jgi:hypothetical protein
MGPSSYYSTHIMVRLVLKPVEIAKWQSGTVEYISIRRDKLYFPSHPSPALIRSGRVASADVTGAPKRFRTTERSGKKPQLESTRSERKLFPINLSILACALCSSPPPVFGFTLCSIVCPSLACRIDMHIVNQAASLVLAMSVGHRRGNAMAICRHVASVLVQSWQYVFILSQREIENETNWSWQRRKPIVMRGYFEKHLTKLSYLWRKESREHWFVQVTSCTPITLTG